MSILSSPFVEVADRNNSTAMVPVTVLGVAVTVQVVSANIELVEENTGTSWKFGITLYKGKTDGSYYFKVKDVASKMMLDGVYAYMISSGGTTIDSVIGRIRIAERGKISDIINISERLLSAITRLERRDKKEKENKNATELLPDDTKRN